MMRLFKTASDVDMYVFISISMKLRGFCDSNCSISARTSIWSEIQFNLVVFKTVFAVA